VKARPVVFIAFVTAILAVAAPSTSSGPIAIALLSDVSFSMARGQLVYEARFESAVRTVAGELRSGDRGLVCLVGNRAVFGPQFRGNSRELAADWRNLVKNVTPADRFGPSPLFDALEAAVTKLRDMPGTKAAILWTDGRPTGNVMGSEEVGSRASAAGVALHVIVDDFVWARAFDGTPMGIDKPCAVFDRMTRASGGACVLNARHRSAPNDQIKTLVARLRRGP
jgi:hypothetical protein